MNNRIKLINDYLEETQMKPQFFCARADISMNVFNIIQEGGLYVSIHDLEKIAQLIKCDISELL